MNDVIKLSQVSSQEELESVFCLRVVLFIECCKDSVPVGGLYGMEGGCTGRFTSPRFPATKVASMLPVDFWRLAVG